MISEFIFKIVFILLLTCRSLSSITEQESGEIESDSVEHNGLIYTFYVEHLSWTEAAALCRSLGGHLAIVNSMELAKTLINAQAGFSEDRVYDDVWIDGRRRGKKWSWKSTGEVIPSSSDATGYPPWLDVGRERQYNCLLLDKIGNKPHFVDQECGSLRSFICEKPVEVKLVVAYSFAYHGRKFDLYNGPVTFDKAVAHCREHNEHLAAATTPDILRIINQHIHSSGLGVSQVWLGAKSDDGLWEWLTSGDSIPEEMESNGYPPWANEKKSTGDCLTVDVVNTSLSHFVGTNCSWQLGFLCERVLRNNGSEVFPFRGYEYLFSTKKLSWDGAAAACKAENGELAALEDRHAVQFIARIMFHQYHSLRTIWLGARRYEQMKWIWNFSGEELDTVIDETNNYPPWAVPPIKQHMNCLSLERTVQENTNFIQKRCGLRQAFLCQREIMVSEPTIIEITYESQHFVIYEKPETWQYAYDYCKKEGSHLAVLNNVEELNFLNNASEIRRSWLGGRFINENWMWYHTNEKIPMDEDSNGFPPWQCTETDEDKHCLQLDMYKKPKFHGANCDSRASFICKKITKTEEQVTFQGKTYTVFSKRVSWSEAASTCRSHKGFLAIVPNIEEAAFLASLTKEYYELWVGGKEEGGAWEWEHTGEVLPQESNSFPPWSKSSTHEGKCLAISRGEDNAPVFVPTECTTAQGFVCQGISHQDVATEKITYIYNERTYIYHPQHLTWRMADQTCRDSGSYLAMPHNLENMKILSDKTKGYPDIWIGGHLINDQWTWAGSGEIIPPRKGGENFPPWVRTKHRANHTCLSINNHQPGKPIFVDKNCEESWPFVCEKADNSTEHLTETVTISSRKFMFIERRVNFSEAINVCRSHDGNLATTDTPDIFNFVLKHGKKYSGVWVGARKYNSKPVWLLTGQSIHGIEGIPEENYLEESTADATHTRRVRSIDDSDMTDQTATLLHNNVNINLTDVTDNTLDIKNVTRSNLSSLDTENINSEDFTTENIKPKIYTEETQYEGEDIEEDEEEIESRLNHRPSDYNSEECEDEHCLTKDEEHNDKLAQENTEKSGSKATDVSTEKDKHTQSDEYKESNENTESSLYHKSDDYTEVNECDPAEYTESGGYIETDTTGSEFTTPDNCTDKEEMFTPDDCTDNEELNKSGESMNHSTYTSAEKQILKNTESKVSTTINPLETTKNDDKNTTEESKPLIGVRGFGFDLEDSSEENTGEQISFNMKKGRIKSGIKSLGGTFKKIVKTTTTTVTKTHNENNFIPRDSVTKTGITKIFSSHIKPLLISNITKVTSTHIEPVLETGITKVFTSHIEEPVQETGITKVFTSHIEPVIMSNITKVTSTHIEPVLKTGITKVFTSHIEPVIMSNITKVTSTHIEPVLKTGITKVFTSHIEPVIMSNITKVTSTHIEPVLKTGITKVFTSHIEEPVQETGITKVFTSHIEPVIMSNITKVTSTHIEPVLETGVSKIFSSHKKPVIKTDIIKMFSPQVKQILQSDTTKVISTHAEPISKTGTISSTHTAQALKINKNKNVKSEIKSDPSVFRANIPVKNDKMIVIKNQTIKKQILKQPESSVKSNKKEVHLSAQINEHQNKHQDFIRKSYKQVYDAKAPITVIFEGKLGEQSLDSLPTTKSYNSARFSLFTNEAENQYIYYAGDMFQVEHRETESKMKRLRNEFLIFSSNDACYKLNFSGEMIELPCKTYQSFVCEISTNTNK